ncbi:MAG: redoxin domain-containing protein [Planctomycetia bacterium]|nr:redoxin domain-containing protein [Planctomycetia bacterium]
MAIRSGRNWTAGLALGLAMAWGIAVVGCDAETESPHPADGGTKAVETKPSPSRTSDDPARPPQKHSADEAPTTKTPAPKNPANKAPVAGKPVPAGQPKRPPGVAAAKRPGKPRISPVLMSEQHRKSCRVFVGQELPQIELPDASGKKCKLADAYGKKLTVVMFCGGNLLTEQQELADLQPEIVGRFGDKGVSVIVVAVGQPQAAVESLAKRIGPKVPVFVDAKREAYKQVATQYLPRTYLLDAAGKILWLDIEYTATTRRQLDEAIRYVLMTATPEKAAPEKPASQK